MRMSKTSVKIGIITYPGCMASAVQGLKEVFLLANGICKRSGVQRHFSVELHSVEMIRQSLRTVGQKHAPDLLQIIIVPPNIEGDYYLNPDQPLIDWLLKHHANGCIVCSACAGAFILAATGLLDQRETTTHWILATEFSNQYPEVLLDTNKILINDGDIITAGGLMSWVDLGLELVAQFANANVMRQLGKLLVVDTGLREQRYYKSFTPKLDHGDHEILRAQHYLQSNYDKPITVATLSGLCFLSERTFLRHFVKATGFKPIQYLQKLRIQKGCELLETTNSPVDTISLKVGYEDTSAFRKTFVKIVGLTPRDFKSRFAGSHNA